MFTYILIAIGLAAMAGICWAGATDPTKLPYPNGPVHITLGGYVPNGVGAGSGAVFQTWIAPFDCIVRKVAMSYRGGTAHLDQIGLKTVDATQKNIVALADMSGDIAGVAQTLHSDCVGFKIVAGNGIQVIADSNGTNEAGHLYYQIELEPYYNPVVQGLG